MATLYNVFLIAFGMSFLAGQVSYGHKLFNVSLNEGERQGCPNTNCAGKVNCKNDAECPESKCCIDAVTEVACCYQPGNPTHAPATTDPQNSAQAPAFPLCTEYFPNTDPECTNTPTECVCTDQIDCYTNEVCCLQITTAVTGPTFQLSCYSTIESTTITTPAPAGGKCPTTTPPLQCAPFHAPGTCLITNPPANTPPTTCLTNEICCKVSRGEPCCVVV